MFVPLWALASLVVALGACAVGIVLLGSRALGADEVARWAHDADQRSRRARADVLTLRQLLATHPCGGADCDVAARLFARTSDILASQEAPDGRCYRKHDRDSAL